MARAAGREAPEVAQKFVFRPGTTTYVAFQTTARAFLADEHAFRKASEEVANWLEKFATSVRWNEIGRGLEQTARPGSMVR